MKTLILTAVAMATTMLTLSAIAQANPAAAAPVDPSAFINQFESTFGMP